MPNITDTMTIATVRLTNLRDTFAERCDHLQEWMDTLDKFKSLCLSELNAFLFELHGDLEDWRRTLSAHLGDDADV